MGIRDLMGDHVGTNEWDGANRVRLARGKMPRTCDQRTCKSLSQTKQ